MGGSYFGPIEISLAKRQRVNGIATFIQEPSYLGKVYYHSILLAGIFYGVLFCTNWN